MLLKEMKKIIFFTHKHFQDRAFNKNWLFQKCKILGIGLTF